MPHLISVNTGNLSPLKVGRRTIRTAIGKVPAAGPVPVTEGGLEGDTVGNHRHHGGPDQAVYLFSAKDLAAWSTELGRPLPPGYFGENLTLDAWWPEPRVGDRLQIGAVLLELTFPRIPCSTLAAHVGESGFVRRFARAGSPGAYARVLSPGTLSAGDAFAVMPGPDTYPTIGSLLELWMAKKKDSVQVRRALAAPIGRRGRDALEASLAR